MGMDTHKKLKEIGLSKEKIDEVMKLMAESSPSDHNEPVLNLQKELWAKGETKGWTKEQTMREINDVLGESIQYAEQQVKSLSEENNTLKDSIRKFRKDYVTDYVEDLYNKKVLVNDVYDKEDLLSYIEKLDSKDEPLSTPLLNFLGRIDNFTAPQESQNFEDSMEGEEDEYDKTSKKDKTKRVKKMLKEATKLNHSEYEEFFDDLNEDEFSEVMAFVEKKRLLKAMNMNEQSEEDFEKDFEEDFKQHDKIKASETKAKGSVGSAGSAGSAETEEEGDSEESAKADAAPSDEEDSEDEEKAKGKGKSKKQAAGEGEEEKMDLDMKEQDNEIGQDDNVPSETVDMHEKAMALMKGDKSMDYVEALKTIVSLEM